MKSFELISSQNRVGGQKFKKFNFDYLQSLVQPKAYIVTQGPTESTMPDFWRMVWQEKASCIVMVTRTFDFIRVMCVQYWPAAKNREEVYAGVGVTVESEEQLANFMIRNTEITVLHTSIISSNQTKLKLSY